MRRKHWKHLVLVMLSVAIALVIAELALDALADAPSKLIPYLSKVMPPGGDWDANGFRNPAVLTHADIVAVGDSQTEGRNASWNDAWPYVLARKAKSSIYSLSLGGYGPVEYAYLADIAITLHPQLAIIGFYFGNDLLDAERMAYEKAAWASLRDPSYVRPPSPLSDDEIERAQASGGLKWRNWMPAHSRVYTLLGDATFRFREVISAAPKQQPIDDFPNPYVYASGSPFSTVLSPVYRLRTLDLADPQTREGWRITQGRFLEIKKKFDGAQIPFVILIIPTKEKVYLEYMRATGQRVPDVFATYDAKEIELLATAERFCQDNGFRCVQVLPDMVKAMQAGTMLYRADTDGHPNVPGYNVIGEALYRHLLEIKYLPLGTSAAK